eukprot:CAMPEP_0118961194 /NCGR_PEP_ID=MMETSP1169-20130426/64018_1 /TAXON_ID=36882 /ORGANISM="Pyramimonas obovata, Strain CCMP722" /LENGTH=463 /DNA_ID=CAMNT_0006909347 /DNA_START=221 /DNA_END=1612 /DNA_ORIENTATION=+
MMADVPSPSKHSGLSQTLGRLQIGDSPSPRGSADGYTPDFVDTTFRSVCDWAESMSPTNGDQGYDDFTHIKQWWGGRGSLWKPISNMDRISRQERRHRQMTLRDDYDGTFSKILHRSAQAGRASTAASPGYSDGMESSSSWEASVLRRSGFLGDPPMTRNSMRNKRASTAADSQDGYNRPPTNSLRRTMPNSFFQQTMRSDTTGITIPNADELVWQNPLHHPETHTMYPVYTPSVAYSAQGRKYPPLRSRFKCPPTPPNRVMQQQWGMPVAHKAPMRPRGENPAPTAGPLSPQAHRYNKGGRRAQALAQARIDWRIKSLPVIPVQSATGVGGLIHLGALQDRCRLNDIDHKFVSQADVDLALETAGCDLGFIENSGLSSLAALEKVEPQPLNPEEEDRKEALGVELSAEEQTRLRGAARRHRQGHKRELNLREPVHIPGVTTVLPNPIGGRFLTTPRFPNVTA